MMLFFRCVAEGLVAQGMKALTGFVPFGPVIYEVANHAWTRYRELSSETKIVAEIKQIEAASAIAIDKVARETARKVAQGRSEEEISLIAAFLAQLQKTIGHSNGAIFSESPEMLASVLPKSARSIFVTCKGANTRAMNRHLSYEKPVSAAQIAALTGFKQKTVRNHLNHWAREGSLLRQGKGPAATFLVHPDVEDIRGRQNNTSSPVAERRIFRAAKGTNTKAINRRLSYEVPASAFEIANSTGVKRDIVVRHLNYWAREGSLRKDGEGMLAKFLIHPDVEDVRD